MVRFSYGLIAKAWPFEKQTIVIRFIPTEYLQYLWNNNYNKTIWSLTYKKSGFQIVLFQIPIVFNIFLTSPPITDLNWS